MLLHSEIFTVSLFLCSCAESQSVPLYLDVETSSFYSELNCAQVRKQLSASDLHFGLRSVPQFNTTCIFYMLMHYPKCVSLCRSLCGV